MSIEPLDLDAIAARIENGMEYHADAVALLAEVRRIQKEWDVAHEANEHLTAEHMQLRSELAAAHERERQLREALKTLDCPFCHWDDERIDNYLAKE